MVALATYSKHVDPHVNNIVYMRDPFFPNTNYQNAKSNDTTCSTIQFVVMLPGQRLESGISSRRFAFLQLMDLLVCG